MRTSKKCSPKIHLCAELSPNPCVTSGQKTFRFAWKEDTGSVTLSLLRAPIAGKPREWSIGSGGNRNRRTGFCGCSREVDSSARGRVTCWLVALRQMTLNHWVVGSIPTRCMHQINDLRRIRNRDIASVIRFSECRPLSSRPISNTSTFGNP